MLDLATHTSAQHMLQGSKGGMDVEPSGHEPSPDASNLVALAAYVEAVRRKVGNVDDALDDGVHHQRLQDHGEAVRAVLPLDPVDRCLGDPPVPDRNE